ncbi:hypothetical protein MKW98_020899 [Papaver atlanticum]|uniref:Uncharacterized protein n=1 Tax=Papaver atlanticum TaxID=357466 RepID=A0AAD4TD36_9MAGN|nr:hypothetical protein MKW98_020898 [Papaver atlanticum]KAI3955266.1 hypothetical protein MKW98_020899 [Papaver atlanticum]
MGSICKSNCVIDDVSEVHPRRKASFAKLNTWPESEKAFLKSISLSNSAQHQQGGAPRVLDPITCRNIYIRSYKFTTEKKKETVPEKAKRCLDKVVNGGKKLRRGRRKCSIVRKVKESLSSLYRKLRSCSTRVDVVDHHYPSSVIF